MEESVRIKCGTCVERLCDLRIYGVRQLGRAKAFGWGQAEQIGLHVGAPLGEDPQSARHTLKGVKPTSAWNGSKLDPRGASGWLSLMPSCHGDLGQVTSVWLELI